MPPLAPQSTPADPTPPAHRPAATAATAGADLESLGERIAELSAHIQAATYQLLVMIREFDERSGWNWGACRSCAHWLNWRTGIDLGAAREKVRVARALAGLPRISAAMRKGEKIDNLIQLCRRHHRAVHEEGFTVELFADGEARFRRPDGWVIEEAPALPPLSGKTVAVLKRRLARQSIQVDAAASLPTWEGGPVDYNHAIQHLRGLNAAAG
jgi:hypothetical protein